MSRKQYWVSALVAILVLAFMAGCANMDENLNGYDYDLMPIDSSSDYRGAINSDVSNSPQASSNIVFVEDFVVAKVNGIDVMASDVNIHLSHVSEMLMWDYFMEHGGWITDHNQEFKDGITFGQAIREEAVRVAAFAKIYEEYARRLGIYLTEEEQLLVDAEIEHLIEHFGMEMLNQLLQEDGFRGIDHLAELYASQFIFESLVHVIMADPQEFAQFEAYMPPEDEEVELLGAKHILAMFGNFDSEEEAELFATVLLERALAGEDFDMLIREYGQDPGMNEFVNGYSFTAGDMVPEFEQATRALQIGEISGLVRSDFGIHIIKRTEPNILDWHLLRRTQPRSLEVRRMEAVFLGFEQRARSADIEFLPELDRLHS